MPTVCAEPETPSTQAVMNPQLLVLDFDGVEWMIVHEMFLNGELQNFQSIGEILVLNLYSGPVQGKPVPSETKPQHAVLLTGLLANETSVWANIAFQHIPDGLTIFEKIEMIDPDTFTALISTKPNNFGDINILGNMKNDVDYFRNETWNNGKTARHACAVLQYMANHGLADGSYLLWVHFRNPDSIGHTHGVYSAEYRQAIRNCDKALGMILDKLELLGMSPEILLLSDHGFGTAREDYHAMSWSTFLISSMPLESNYYHYQPNGAYPVYMNWRIPELILEYFGVKPPPQTVPEQVTLEFWIESEHAR